MFVDFDERPRYRSTSSTEVMTKEKTKPTIESEYAAENKFVAALMELALSEARLALDHDDVPVGAVVAHLDSGLVIAQAHNQREQLNDPTAHAEIIALRAAAVTLGTWRLSECLLVVTLEPCPMCAGACTAAHIGHVVYGAADAKAGALGSLYHFGSDPRLHHEYPVTGGVQAEAGGALLSEFFAAKRA